MAKITIEGGFAFAALTVAANEQAIILPRMLIDTGSLVTAIKTDQIYKLGLRLPLGSRIRYMRGVGGGREAVLEMEIASLAVEEAVLSPFRIQVGELDYGIELDGILGLDFLLRTGMTLNFRSLEMQGASRKESDE